MPKLKHRVLEYMKAQSMPMPPGKVLVALSGGLDSVALLLLLQEIGFDLLAAHANFGLRKEADADEAFCRQLCAAKGISFVSRQFDTYSRAAKDRKGKQDAARKLRYEWFEELAAKENCSGIALGHHADDQVETLLMSMLGGEARSVFKGIPPKNGLLFRPLLTISKTELKAYLELVGQGWVEDASNATNDYDRNFLRNEAIPLLMLRFPGFGEVLQAKEQAYISQQAALEAWFEQVLNASESDLGHAHLISASAMREHLPEEQIPTFLEWWAARRWKRKQVGELGKLWLAKSGASLHIEDWQLRRLPDGIQFEQVRNPDFDGLRWPDLPAHGSEHLLGAWHITIDWLDDIPKESAGDVLYIYVQASDFPLVWRKPLAGERLQPIGMSGSKSMTDILADDKRSLTQRENALVLEAARGVLCLLPGRASRLAAERQDRSQLLGIRFRFSV
jgi:tRNA(Ile)-lysidine synthase